MAKKYGVDVTNIGLVAEQNAVLEDLIRKNGLGDRVRVVMDDHRNAAKYGPFDRYVSVGVMEHAGRSQAEAWVKSIADSLKDGGIGVMSTMSHAKRQLTSFLITKHIFPGGYMPSMAELRILMEKYGLEILEQKDYRQHYGYAVEDWHERMIANWDRIQKIDPKLFDERFKRLWSMYLLGSAFSFSGKQDTLTVSHITFRKGRSNVRLEPVEPRTSPHEHVLTLP
jgi:cyclopropane-fatty-acyl-phospholipid synthase